MIALLQVLRSFSLVVVSCLLAIRSEASDWPRLGGVAGAGISDETGLVRSFPQEGPPVLWSVGVGEGFAGPAVSEGEVFLLDRPSKQQDVLRCFELRTGKELWTVAYEAPGSLPYNGSRNVPTVDEQHVFTVGPFGHFHCIDRRSHRVVWKAHLVDDFKDPQVDDRGPAVTREQKLARAQVPMWGLTQAPLLYRDMVIVAPQTQKTGLVAYDKATGKIRWQSGYIGRNWYSHVSPYLAKLCGVEQLIMLAQPSDPEKAPEDAPPAIISSIDPSSGRILWTARTPGPHKIPMAQPLQVGDDRLFITGGYTFGCMMLRVSHKADKWDTKFLFHSKEVAAHIHSPVLYENRIYVTSFKDQGGVRTGLVCLSDQGEPLWQTGPSLQFEYGGFIVAEDKAFVMHGKTGEICLLGLSRSGYELLSRAKVLEAKGVQVWAPMALSDGKLIVRDQHQMKCLDVTTSR
ncbi:MAG TPA: PQQ-binding-like beta-propeller repeat protein [Clostridia bacterium]|nr:PQQ-binding-like beta-propeller repeat protein [Clostridia bacterium]